MVQLMRNLLTRATLASILLPSLTSAHSKEDEALTIPNLSLPDLSKLDYVDSLSITDWDILGDGVFLDGRIILTPEANTKSTLVNKNRFANQDQWTVELIFRSLNQVGRTGSGLSLQLLNSEYGPDKDADYIFGGAFDGLNVVVDAESSKANAIHAYLNDGSKGFKSSENVYDDSFGSCLIGYQDSQVPNTMRVAYSKGEYLLVQIDNRICLKTDKVSLSDIKFFNIYVKALTGSIHEQFEILKLKVYEGIITEIQENMDKFAHQPMIVKTVVDALPPKDKPASQPSQQQQQQQPLSSNQDLTAIMSQLKELTHSNLQLQSKLITLESKLTSYQSQLRAAIDAQFESLKNEKTNYNPPSTPGTSKESSDALTKQLNSLVSQFSTKLESLKSQAESAAAASSNDGGSGLDLSHMQSVKWWLMMLLFVVLCLIFVLGYSLVYLRNELKRKIL
ncbi:hypothetical protein WICPIJ_008051 [Wickerhamomyces pijperi]|uniref:L-type lectin-like domain-containing protein n=1 Tax=Wickerhamomyces pijperi TaxID=599730 RepID=A0A9P8PZ27_WICPI|nr:hypothetical protein WICPIJ_008051 [Wickerhamomyces pijperi]